MALGFCTIRQSLYVNLLADIFEEQDKLAGARSDAGNNKAPIFLEIPTSIFVLLSSKNLFTKFMKVFIKIMQARDQALAELQKRSLKARTPKTYRGKSYIECYNFC